MLILLPVAANRGMAVLPDRVVRDVHYHSDYVTRPITKAGLTRSPFTATRAVDSTKPFMARHLRPGRTIPVRLQGGAPDETGHAAEPVQGR